MTKRFTTRRFDVGPEVAFVRGEGGPRTFASMADAGAEVQRLNSETKSGNVFYKAVAVTLPGNEEVREVQ